MFLVSEETINPRRQNTHCVPMQNISFSCAASIYWSMEAFVRSWGGLFTEVRGCLVSSVLSPNSLPVSSESFAMLPTTWVFLLSHEIGSFSQYLSQMMANEQYQPHPFRASAPLWNRSHLHDQRMLHTRAGCPAGMWLRVPSSSAPTCMSLKLSQLPRREPTCS